LFDAQDLTVQQATVWDGLVAMVVGNGVPIVATSQ
jgi:hypothetical protein